MNQLIRDMLNYSQTRNLQNWLKKYPIEDDHDIDSVIVMVNRVLSWFRLGYKRELWKKEKKYGREKRELALNSLLLFTDIVYQITSVITVIMMGITFIMALYTMIIFFTGKPIEGWTTLALFISISFFGLFAVLTMIVKYQAVLLDLNFKKKTYTFDTIEKISK